MRVGVAHVRCAEGSGNERWCRWCIDLRILLQQRSLLEHQSKRFFAQLLLALFVRMHDSQNLLQIVNLELHLFSGRLALPQRNHGAKLLLLELELERELAKQSRVPST